MTSPRARGGGRSGEDARRSVLLALSMSLASGCFLQSINRAPEVNAINQSGLFQRGEDVQFTASVNDPDGDDVELSWGATLEPDGCPSKDDRSKWPARMVASTFRVSGALTAGPFCVWVFATDRYGATGVLNQLFAAVDRPPVAVVDTNRIMPLYRLYTAPRVDGSGSYDPDGDDLTFTWSLQSPSGSPVPLVSCGDADTQAIACFQATQPGVYTGSLVVTALGAASTPAPFSVRVLEDSFPCIALANHDLSETTVLLDSSVDQDFQILRVDDDGDAFPPTGPTQNATFAWFVTPPDAAVGTSPVAQDVFFPTLTIAPDTFKLGDVSVVRVEVHDRQVDAIERHLRACGDSPTCATTDPLTNATCYQRFSWNVKWIL